MHDELIALQTIVRKETIRIMRIWSQTLLPPVITQSLYFVIFGQFIGAHLGEMKGVHYMAFIVPGLVMMSVINSSFGNVVSSFFSSKFQRNIEEVLVSPTPNWVILFGYILGGMMRGMLVGFLVFLVSCFFTHPVIYSLPLIFLFIILTSVLFALGGFLNGILARNFDDIALFPNFVLVPLTYLGGVFYSIDGLPSIWRNLSMLNPVLYMVNGFRYGFYQVTDVPIGFSIALILGLIVLLSAINLHLLNQGAGIKS